MSIDELPRFSPLGFIVLGLLVVGLLWLVWSILAMPFGTMLLFGFGIAFGYVLGRA